MARLASDCLDSCEIVRARRGEAPCTRGPRFARQVVIGVLPRQLSANRVPHQRVVSEAGVSSSPGHRSIGAVHEIGSAAQADFLFIEPVS